MSCDCTDISVFVSPSDTGVQTNIVAPSTGDFTAYVEFNGAYNQYVLSCTSGQKIVFPNVFNGDYVHKVDLFKPDTTLLGCYKIKTNLVECSGGNGLTPTPAGKDWKIVTVTENADTLTDSFLLTHTISEIVTQGQSYLVGVNFTQSGDTITGIDISFYVDQIVKLQV